MREVLARAREEYRPDEDCFTADSPRLATLKRALAAQPLIDQTLLILYAECQRYSRIAKMMGLNKDTVRNRIIKARKRIQAELKYEDIR